MKLHAEVKQRGGRMLGAARVSAMMRRDEIALRREWDMSVVEDIEGGCGVQTELGSLSCVQAATKLDLKKGVARDLADAVQALGPALEASDYALLDAAIVRGTSMTLLAGLRGESVARTRRRVKMLLRLVLAFEFEFVIRRRAEWPPRMRVVADACILRGLSIRRAAALLRLSMDQVRRERARVLRLAASMKAA